MRIRCASPVPAEDPLRASRRRWAQRLTWFALAASAMLACSSDTSKSKTAGKQSPTTRPTPPASPSTSEPEEAVETPPPRAQKASETTPSMDLHDPDILPHFELTFDPAAMAILSNPAESEKMTWVHAQFKFGAITFADVGVRRKGTSTYQVLPKKAALKVKFNKWTKGQKLYGVEELTLNNMDSDATNLVERLSYHVYRSLDLPASKANTAHLTINGEDYGLFANVETPDENFLARVFGDQARTLYEVNDYTAWLPTPDAHTAFEIDVPAPGALAGAMPDLDLLLTTVAAAKDESLLLGLSGHLHTKQWLRYCAAEAVTGNADGYAYGIWLSHNYFMAGDVEEKFSLIPWSTDLSLSDRQGLTDAANPVAYTALARCKNSACWQDYKAEVQAVIGVYETLDLVNLAKKWHEQIDSLARSDPKRDDGTDFYEAETARLYEWLAARPSVLRGQLGL